MMTDTWKSGEAEDEETLNCESMFGDETLGLNKYTQQKFLETAETPSLLVILTSLLRDLLSNGSTAERSSTGSNYGCCSSCTGGEGSSSSSSQGDSSSSNSSSGATAAAASAQQKTRREREKRPLAEDIEYLRAMALPVEQQQVEGRQQQQQGPVQPAKQQQQQAELSREQGEQQRGGTAHHLGQQPRGELLTKSEDQQQQDAACKMLALKQMMAASTAPPAASSSRSSGEQEETHQEAAGLEAVSFVLEEESPADVSFRGDMRSLSSSSSYDSQNSSSGRCCVTSSRRTYEANSSSSSKEGCTERLQQPPDETLVEQQWCSGGTALQKGGEEDVDSLFPTRCSSGDEQQWDPAAAAAAARVPCASAADRSLPDQQQETPLPQERLLQEQLRREQAQQAQLKELMWGVAAAFEIQQLLSPRVRARSKRMREARAREEARQKSSPTCGGRDSRAADGEGSSSSNSSSGESSSSSSRACGGSHNGGSDPKSCCCCCSANSAQPDGTGGPLAGSSSSSTTVISTCGSISCTTAGTPGRDSMSSTQIHSSCTDTCANEPCSSSSSSGASNTKSGSTDTAGQEAAGCGDICGKEQAASGVAGGSSNASSSEETCSLESGCTGVHDTCHRPRKANTSSSEEPSCVECKRSLYDNPTGSQNIESEDKDSTSSASSRCGAGEKKSARRTCGELCTVKKRLKVDHSAAASSKADGSSENSSTKSGDNSCAASSSSSNSGGRGSTGGHDDNVSNFTNTSASCPEGARASIHEKALTSSSSSGAKEAGRDNTSGDGSCCSSGEVGHQHLEGSCCCSGSSDDVQSDSNCASESTSNVASSSSSVASKNSSEASTSGVNAVTSSTSCSRSCGGTGLTPSSVCDSQREEGGSAAAAEDFPPWRCCCGEGGAEAPAEVWRRRGLLQYDALYDRWRTFLTQFAPSGMALAVCFGKSYLFHILHESLWQLLEELRLTAAGETPQRLRTFVLGLAAAAGLSSTHAEQLLSNTLFQHGNPADSILPSETGLGFLHRDAGGAREEQLGIISFCCITNDRQPQHLLQLLTIKSIFSRQLPKMPREYIVRLVFDRNHFTFCLCKRGRVTGGVCFRPYFKERFAEIAFLAVTSTEQVKGYGTRLMNHLKEHVKKSNIEYFLTYADNFALGYFRKQGFSSRITMPRDRWVGYIKDYDGGTLMECKISQKINYLQLSQLLAKQKLAVKRFIEVCSPAPLCPPITFWKENPGKLLSPLEIPSLVKLGYTAAHWLSMQPLLPATAAGQSTGESEEQQASRRAGSAAARGASSEARMVDDGSKQRDSRPRGADFGEGRSSCPSSSGGMPAANDGGSVAPAATAGVLPYLHHFGVTAGASVATGSVGQSLKARVAALLNCLEKHSSSWPFRKPVSVNEAPDYYEVICRPMDISSMKKKNRAGEYQTVAAVRADLQLMFDNCRLYNSQDTIYYKYADELQAFIWPKLNVLEESAGP